MNVDAKFYNQLKGYGLKGVTVEKQHSGGSQWLRFEMRSMGIPEIGLTVFMDMDQWLAVDEKLIEAALNQLILPVEQVEKAAA